MSIVSSILNVHSVHFEYLNYQNPAKKCFNHNKGHYMAIGTAKEATKTSKNILKTKMLEIHIITAWGQLWQARFLGAWCI